jgi:hypothetical protein
VLTCHTLQAHLYTVALIQKKATAIHKLERMIAVANITGATMSTMGDNMIVVRVACVRASVIAFLRARRFTRRSPTGTSCLRCR